MTRTFHLIAGALFVIFVGLDISRPPTAIAAFDPRQSLTELMNTAGLNFQDEKTLLSEYVLSFTTPGCEDPVDVLVVPAVQPGSTAARDLVRSQDKRRLVVYDGALLSGSGIVDVMPRWFWNKLLVTLHVKAIDPWTKIVLFVLVPTDCTIPAVDWTKLRQMN